GQVAGSEGGEGDGCPAAGDRDAARVVRFETVVQLATRDRLRNVRARRDVRDRVLCFRGVEERDVGAERAEEVAPVAGVAREELGRRRRLERVVCDTPEPDADVGDVVGPAPWGDPSRFEAVGGDVEGRADRRPAGRAADVERHYAAPGEVVQVLRGRELLEELDGARVPAAHVTR